MEGLGRLDDQDYPAYTTGQVAELLNVRQAFLRSLDAAGVVQPQRSEGGHRRYSRRQMAVIALLREQFDQGHTLAAAARIVQLQGQLAAAEDEISGLRRQLHTNPASSDAPSGDAQEAPDDDQLSAEP